jgi:hypothetical protein
MEINNSSNILKKRIIKFIIILSKIINNLYIAIREVKDSTTILNNKMDINNSSSKILFKKTKYPFNKFNKIRIYSR